MTHARARAARGRGPPRRSSRRWPPGSERRVDGRGPATVLQYVAGSLPRTRARVALGRCRHGADPLDERPSGGAHQHEAPRPSRSASSRHFFGAPRIGRWSVFDLRPGRLEAVPGWPEAPSRPQPMVTWPARCLDRYAAGGGAYREVVLPGRRALAARRAPAGVRRRPARAPRRPRRAARQPHLALRASLAGEAGGRALGQLAWRAALRAPQLPSRGSASSAPLTLLRRNSSPSRPESSRALTTEPSGRVTREPAVT